jgi:GNAT superfamily N-acetyltransferase
MTKEDRREFQKDLACQGLASGLMVYDEDSAVTWCQFGPAERFPRFDGMRAYQALEIATEFAPQWRISCLFVDKHRRKEGLSRYAFQAALEIIRAGGGGIVEAFPFDIAGITRPQYTGSVKMFAQAGFQEVARLGKHTLLMRLKL